MPTRPSRRLAAAAALLLAPVCALAQPAARPDPLNPRAEVPLATHNSSLSRYRPAGEVEVGSWRDANDTVTRIGGWRSYARQAAQPAAAASASAAAPSAAAGHGAHHVPVRP